MQVKYVATILISDAFFSFLIMFNSCSITQIQKACDELAESKMKVANIKGFFHLGRHAILPVSLDCVC